MKAFRVIGLCTLIHKLCLIKNRKFAHCCSGLLTNQVSNKQKMGDENATSKTLLLTGFGGYDKIEVKEISREKAEEGEVLVNIKAAGINFAELMARSGMYDRMPSLPAILGFEGAGVVHEIGKGVKMLQVGDRVICLADFTKGGGTWQEFVRIPEEQCFVMPEKMTFEEGAAIPVNYITAYHMLFEFGNLRPNKSVLIHMVAGGVGFAATQLCRTVEKVTIFGTCSGSKHKAVQSNGVDYPIDYHTQDYATEVRKISPTGVDIVLDPLSGGDAVKGWNLLKPLGKIIHFGAANIVTGPQKSWWQIIKTYMSLRNYSPLGMISQNKAACGYHLGHLTDKELVQSAAQELLELYKAKKIKPQIDSVWAFEDIGKAMARMHERQNVGKVIICPRKNPENK